MNRSQAEVKLRHYLRELHTTLWQTYDVYNDRDRAVKETLDWLEKAEIIEKNDVNPICWLDRTDGWFNGTEWVDISLAAHDELEGQAQYMIVNAIPIIIDWLKYIGKQPTGPLSREAAEATIRNSNLFITISSRLYPRVG